MLVDLGRNDVGRVAKARDRPRLCGGPFVSAQFVHFLCAAALRVQRPSSLLTGFCSRALSLHGILLLSQAGSVKVERLMEIERYSHVMHISSTVTGERPQFFLAPRPPLKTTLPPMPVAVA